jgi:hypothetical protein
MGDGNRGDALKRSIAAAAGLAMLVLTPAAASAQVCVVGIFAAAIYVGAQEKRELTTKEAMTCGLSYMFDSKEEKPKKKPKKKKQPRTARKP